MFRLLTALVILLFSFTAGSSGSGQTAKWSRVKDIIFESPAQLTPAGYSMHMRLYYNKGMRIELIVSNPSAGGGNICKIMDVPNLPNNWDINGQIITYDAECENDKFLRLWPKEKNEAKYVIDEFLTKSVVHVGPTTISTKGFIEGYSEVLSYASYLE